MLENIPSRKSHRRVFRMANIPNFEEFVGELNLDARSSDEVRKLLSTSGYSPSPHELLDTPFRVKRRLHRPTRFSDGSFPVFYSSPDPKTAEAEVKHWIPRYGDTCQSLRTAYYQQFACRFDGIEKDLRPKLEEWPDLVHDSDYSFCNRLGSEASRLDLDGLVTQSARYHGSNLAAFRRRAVGNPTLQGRVAMTYDPTTGKVSARDIEE